ncbi:MAG TPA: FecR family protein [bacterium]|nr:FecR family protein [bacterium]HNT66484.1 FecR family protein [bacterium]HOX85592.1 FecR family protein [bacterium]HPG44751.1 FecR family protein [bacterium]HPM99077.1 FecR family protein [bacterium]
MRQYLILVLVILFGQAAFALAAAPGTEQDIALVLKVKGDAQIKTEASDWKSLTRGARLASGSEIRTGNDALVALVFTDDKSMMKIRQDSQVLLKGKRQENKLSKQIAVDLGAIWARITPGGAGFRMETPSGVAAVKGTEFYGIVGQDGLTTIIGIRGLIELFNDMGSILVGAGQKGSAKKDQLPTLEPGEDYDDWANDTEQIDELEIEFQNEQAETKILKIKYRKTAQ